MKPLMETERTRLRLPAEADAPFFLELLNDPLFIRFTGDRGIRDLAGARSYITDRLLATQQKHDFTLWLVETEDGNEPIGINGLVQRPYLDAPDIGFGFLERFCGQGFGTETSHAVMAYAQDVLGHRLIYGITTRDNLASVRLLEKLGLRHNRTHREPDSESVHEIYQLDCRS